MSSCHCLCKGIGQCFTLILRQLRHTFVLKLLILGDVFPSFHHISINFFPTYVICMRNLTFDSSLIFVPSSRHDSLSISFLPWSIWIEENALEGHFVPNLVSTVVSDTWPASLLCRAAEFQQPEVSSAKFRWLFSPLCTITMSLRSQRG